MYSTHNERKAVVAGKLIRTLKNIIYKYMTSIPKTVYIDNLDGIVNKYNNTYHNTMKIKPVDVKSNTYTKLGKGINEEDTKLKIGHNVRISKHKNILAKVYTPNWSEKVILTKTAKNTVSRTYVTNDFTLMEKKLLAHFAKKNWKQQIKKKLEFKK